LEKKGIITIDELDEKKKEVAARLVKKFSENGLGLLYQDPEMDKYTFNKTSDVPCDKMIETCNAVCCKLPFALSHQDVEEGIVKWEFGRPYVIAHGSDGYCVHVDQDTYRCNVYDNRPVPCRGFNCQDCKTWKIWKDSEGKELHPDFEKSLQEAIEMFYARKNRP
jgi:Fe-S-cluster containining protein